MNMITLNNGVKMPVIGFGVFQIQDQTLFGKNEDPVYAKMINSVKIHGEQ